MASAPLWLQGCHAGEAARLLCDEANLCACKACRESRRLPAPFATAAASPSLMHRSLLSQALRVREVFDFVQGDLRHHKAMLLDNYNEVFLWIGPQCNAIVQRMSLSLAQVAATACMSP